VLKDGGEDVELMVISRGIKVKKKKKKVKIFARDRLILPEFIDQGGAIEVH